MRAGVPCKPTKFDGISFNHKKTPKSYLLETLICQKKQGLVHYYLPGNPPQAFMQRALSMITTGAFKILAAASHFALQIS